MPKKRDGSRPPPKKRKRFPMEFWAGGRQIRLLRDPLKIPIPPLSDAEAAPASSPKGKAGSAKAPAKKFRKYDSYLVEYYDGSKRMRVRRSSFPKAMNLIESLKIKFLNGKTDALQFEGRDQLIYQSAVEQLKSLKRPVEKADAGSAGAGPAKVPDLTVDQAVVDFVKAANLLFEHELTVIGVAHEVADFKKRLGSIPLSTAVDFFEKFGTSITEKKNVPEIVTELLKSLRDDKNTEYHIRDTKFRLERFSKTFPGQILGISTNDINEWLRGLKSKARNHEGEELAGKSRNNLRGAVVQLFNFAKEKGYLSRELPTAADATKKIKEVGEENEVFTPEEMEKMLSKASEKLIPSLALKAFSGVRTEELIKMHWSHLHFENKSTNLTKDITKLTQRRTIRMQPNLQAWLEPHKKPEGRICFHWTTPSSATQMWRKLARSLGIKNSKNKFRNSYISYRLAQTKDIALVADESGNSPAVIKREYMDLVTEQDAAKWFAIFPKDKKPV